MKNLNGVETQNGFSDEAVRGLGLECNLSIAALRDLDGVKIHHEYTKGSRIFVEGQLPEGVHLLSRGRVKLITHSPHGKALIMNVAVPGDVLGLSATVSNVPYDATAETIETCHVDFVPKVDFFLLLNRHPDIGMNAIKQLSRQCNLTNAQVRSFGLSSCVADKLTKLLIDWSDNSLSNNGSVHLKVSFSHEEIGEMIGASRETVTRLLKTFRERGLISIKGSDLFIPDKHKLEATIGNGKGLH